MTKTGPNDAGHVVQLMICTCFFFSLIQTNDFFFVFFDVLIIYSYATCSEMTMTMPPPLPTPEPSMP